MCFFEQTFFVQSLRALQNVIQNDEKEKKNLIEIIFPRRFHDVNINHVIKRFVALSNLNYLKWIYLKYHHGLIWRLCFKGILIYFITFLWLHTIEGGYIFNFQIFDISRTNA